MRWFLVSLALVVAACGGGTPDPKSSDDEKASSNEQGTSTAAPADKPATAAAASATPEPPAAPPAADPKPAAADDVWMAPHQMQPGDVLKTMRPAQSKVQGCYRAGLKRDPSTSGEVKVRFVISNDGEVRAWRDEASSMTDVDVTNCVGELVKKLKFPKQKSPGDAWGIYTINFSP
ncbi:MAG TPA: AgmX/PglI C-terminal domain-containing protein [Polyangiaceae bacterium]|nr:AgmX/PglI C-terminal domain-containing protein [Polyangiaceae bacterium]